MPLLPSMSSPAILTGGVVGALAMCAVGFQLGKPVVSHDPSPLPVVRTTYSPVPFTSAQTVPSATQAENSVPLESPPPSTVELVHQQAEPSLSNTTPSDTAPQSQPSAEFLTTTVAPPHPRHPASMTPAWPVALQPVDFQTLGFSPMQQAMVQQVQEQFMQEVGGPNQDPADPAYGQRWLTAAQRANEILRAKIGWEAFNAYSRATTMGAAAPQ